MIDFIYKPKDSRIWRWKVSPTIWGQKNCRMFHSKPLTSGVRKNAGTKCVKEKLHERDELILPKVAREAAQRSLSNHLNDFLGDMRRRGKSDKYLANIEFRVSRLITECGWKLAKDVTADSFQAWLRAHRELKDKTANDYLEAARCFFNWLVRLGRAGSNPLLTIQKGKNQSGQGRRNPSV